MKFIRIDIRRALTEPSLLLALLIGSLMALGSFIYYLYIGIEGERGDLLFQKSQQLILPFFAPVLAAIPYSNMNTLEEDTGYQRLLYLRVTAKGYQYKRLCSVLLAGGITIVIPVFLIFLLSAVWYPTRELQELSIVLLYDFMFGAVYAMLSYALTFYCKKRYLSIIIPQVFYMLFTYAVPYLRLYKYYLPRAFTPWMLAKETTNIPVWLTLWFIFVLAIILLFIQSIRNYQRKGR